jgi:hypothetical protein
MPIVQELIAIEKIVEGAVDMAQATELLLSKSKALNSNPSMAKKQRDDSW